MNLSLFVRRDLDIGLLSAICLGIGVGITTIYSASYNWDLGLAGNIYEKQIIWASLGFIAMVITMVIPLKLFYAFAYVLYGMTVALLVLVLELGDRRWLNVGPIHIQPSEFAKITTVLVFARFLAYPNRDVYVPLLHLCCSFSCPSCSFLSSPIWVPLWFLAFSSCPCSSGLVPDPCISFF